MEKVLPFEMQTVPDSFGQIKLSKQNKTCIHISVWKTLSYATKGPLLCRQLHDEVTWE